MTVDLRVGSRNKVDSQLQVFVIAYKKDKVCLLHVSANVLNQKLKSEQV